MYSFLGGGMDDFVLWIDLGYDRDKIHEVVGCFGDRISSWSWQVATGS